MAPFLSTVRTLTISYSVRDQLGGRATRAISAAVDPGPTLIASAPALVAAGATVQVGSATARIAGDALPLVFLNGPSHGSLTLLSNGAVEYAAGGTVPNGGYADAFAYEVKDHYGDLSAPVSATLTVDPGPSAKSGTLTGGHVQSGLDETPLVNAPVSAGVAGDGTAIVGVTPSGGKVLYSPPVAGSPIFGYAVANRLGQTASGTMTVTVDPGPTAGTVSQSVRLGQTADLTQAILSEATPGIKGDKLTISADAAARTLGAVSFANGVLTYAAGSAAFPHVPANGSATDPFGYTISDQYGDVASGTPRIMVTNPATTIKGEAHSRAWMRG